ncbi:MAG: phosphoesterase [Flavobacteriaceae bacterium]|nr:MAG: phosphoesterase [Flavobacteriaceae bacterium]
MKTFKKIVYSIPILLISACATYKTQFAKSNIVTPNVSKKIAYTFYLIGDAGNADINSSTKALEKLRKEMNRTDKNATLLFLGDNIYPSGVPEKTSKEYTLAKHRIQTQIDIAKDFKGNTYFIPGNHDWYHGLDGLKRQEKLIEKIVGKNTFLPENGCPLERVKIAKDIDLIIIDTHWYLTNWDHHPKMNDNCEIKTRKKFFDELKGLIKKARGKTTIIAMHHPMFSQGPHAGNYSFKSHMSPIPVLGTLKNIVRKTTGASNADIQNKKYRELKKRIVALSQKNEKIIFVSGHEHSLQYIVRDNIPQIISGSGAKVSPTKLSSGGKFAYGQQGYAKLLVYEDGSSKVFFYAIDNQTAIFESDVLHTNRTQTANRYPADFPKTKSASVYTAKETSKGKTYKFFWGERYRKYYHTNVNVPTVRLDTLFGGLTPVRKGGGNQSKSLRLKDNNGRQYVMRALRKNALQYLQSVAFKDQYIEGQFDDTYTQNLLLDVFTGSHPYAPFIIAPLANAVGIYHTNPVLYYIPKQERLGIYNHEFGDELYMIEERATSGHGDKKSFGFSDKLISTDDLLKKIHTNENHLVDEKAYIRARLFDMLIGDWDRHEDQWRWAVFKEGKKTIYRPVPRDRDQAFSIMADGTLLSFATKVVPKASLLQSYSEELKDVVGFNIEPYPLDMAIINTSAKSDWDQQVQHIVTNLTDDRIEKAFILFPKEVRDKTIDEIKQKLIGRRKNLQKISDTYFKHLNKFQIIKGTDKDDWFDIERFPDGKTKVTAYRIKKGKKGVIFHQKTYQKEHTKELWIYGLDDDDMFVVRGKGNHLIKVRIIGGQNKDTYNIINRKKIIVYDFKAKKNIFTINKGKKRVTNDYKTNLYDYKKLKDRLHKFMPSIGRNPDDGIRIGVANKFIANDFERNPFTYKYTLAANLYLATKGYDISYTGELAHITGKANLGFDATFTSPNFANNFFGFGNESLNPEADENDGLDVGLDYNRVRIRQFRFGTSLIWRGDLDSKVRLGISYEAVKVEKTAGRFVANTPELPATVFNNQNFIGSELSYYYKNTDSEAFPTLGMETDLRLGHTFNTGTSKGFVYFTPSIAFNYPLAANKKIVFATKLGGHINLNNNLEFYQGANLGADNGLRGYRNQRFIGKRAFYQSSDIRVNIKKIKTGLVTIILGIYGGFDYGKVWIDDYETRNWNTSVGGGIFLNAAEMISAGISAFNSNDELRLSFGFGFGF